MLRSENMYLKIGKLPLEKSSKRLYGPAKIKTNASSAVENIYVVKTLDRCLLGRPAIWPVFALGFYVSKI